MPKQHRSKSPAKPAPEKQNSVEQPGTEKPEPQYASEVNPEPPYLDHEPAMRWELRELAHRVEILEAALSQSSQSEDEGAAASAPV